LMRRSGLTGGSGYGENPDNWFFTVSSEIRTYRTVKTLGDFFDVRQKEREKYARMRQAPLGHLPSVSAQSSLPNASVPSDLSLAVPQAPTVNIADRQTGSPPERPQPPQQAAVFVVHGHDVAARETVARFLEHAGLRPIILHEQVNAGLTILEKFERYANVAYAIVLLTPDDIGASQATPDTLSPRARQNVILELGYFVGKLGRDRVCPLYKAGVELPSDLHGLVYVPMDDAEAWQIRLAKELEAAGLPMKHGEEK